MKKTFCASIDYLPEMLQFVRSMVHPIEFDPTSALKIEMAVEEALVNIIHYAYPAAGADTNLIHITCNPIKNDEGIDIIIIDDGISFDPVRCAKEKFSSLTLDKQFVGGYGIQLIMQVMDEVSYSREGEQNILMISKHR